MKNRHHLTSSTIAGLLLCGLVATQAQPVITVPAQSRVESVGDHLAFSVGATGAAPLTYQWYFGSTAIPNATNLYLVVSNAQVTNSGTYSVIVSNASGLATNSATLQITEGLQPLSSSNVVVVRVGDGSQALSFVKGNTAYLDQYTSNGDYVNTIQIPDTLPNALILPGAPTNGVFMGFLGRSANSEYLTLGGFNVSQPNTTASSIASGSARAIGVVGANGYFALSELDSLYYTTSPGQFNSAVSTDGLRNYWLTGIGSSDGLRYVHVAFNASSYVNLNSPGKTCHVAEIDPLGNVAFTCSNATGFPGGLNVFSSQPTNNTAFSSLFIQVASTASPEDFAISPDYNTIYIADDSGTASAGIERWDNVSGAWQYSYTLSSGVAAGASGLTVNFGASVSWGQGVTGAVLYSTTAGGGSNSLIQIVDDGSSSTPVTVVKAGPNQMLRGLRFGPVGAPPVITSEPQPGAIYPNGTAYFAVTASGPLPLTYQWQLNGVNIAGATNSNFTLAGPAGANLGNYTVVVQNASGSVTSSPVGVTLESTPTAPYPVAVLNDSPLAFWRLDETSGTTAYDLLNSFYDGYYNNVVLGLLPGYDSATDGSEPAAEFGTPGGSSDVTGIPLDLAINGTAEFSVEAWINTRGNPQFGSIAAIRVPGTSDYEFSLDTSADGVPGALGISITATNGDTFSAASTNVIEDSNWHHVVGICDQSDAVLALYMDGHLLTSSNFMGEGMMGIQSYALSNIDTLYGPPVGGPLYNEEFSPSTYDTNMVIGGADVVGDSGVFSGDISQVAVYSYALSSNQVATHYLAAGIAPSAVVITPPAAQLDNGATIELSASTFASLPLYWQWSSNGVPLTWATNASVTLTNLQGEAAYTFTVLVSNAFGNTQNSAVVTVYAGAPQIVMDILPLNATNGVGGAQTFTAEILGSQPISFQWQFDGTNLSDGGGVSGSHTSTLTLTDLQLAEAGSYQLFASNAAGTSATSVAGLSVVPLTFQASNLWTVSDFNGPSATFSGDTLTLTEGLTNNPDLVSAFGDETASIASFEASWTFQQSTNETSSGPGDGFAFVLQNSPGGASAISYGNLAYGFYGLTGEYDGTTFTEFTNSVALEFNTFTGDEFITPVNPGLYLGSNAIGYDGLYYDAPYGPTGAVNLASGDPIQVTVAYGGSVLIVSLNDASAGTTFSTNYKVNIPAIVGSNTAYVGFTASTRMFANESSVQQLSDFTFGPSAFALVTPSSQSADAGQSVTFQASAFPESPPPTYQWSSNGVTLSGATNSTLVISNAQGSGAETYSVLATTSVGIAEASGVLTVYSGAPQILTNVPNNVSEVEGWTLVLSPTIVGSVPISYQWQFNGTNLSDGGGVSGSHTSTLTLTDLQLAEAGTYQLLAANAFGTNANAVADLVVESLNFGDGSIWSVTNFEGDANPDFSGGTLYLTTGNGEQFASAFGNQPLDISAFEASWTYQEATNDSGSAGDGFAFVLQNCTAGASAVSYGELGYVNGGFLETGTVNGISDSVALEFGLFTGSIYYSQEGPSNTAPGLAIGTNGTGPGDGYGGPYGPTGAVNLASGDPIQVTVVYGQGNMNVSLSDAVAGTSFTTNFTVNIPAMVEGDTAYVGFTGSTEWDGEDSSQQRLSDFSFGAIAVVSVTPASQVADAGQTVTFQANPYPTNAPITYQWSSNSTPLTGATNSTLVLSDVGGLSNQTYSVMISNSVGTAEGSGTLTVYSGPPQVLTNLPTSIVAGIGDTLTLSATMVGTYPISYQWQFDGTNLANSAGVAGAQTSTLTLSSVQLAEAGNYQLLASNAFGTNATSVATVSVVTISLSAASDWTINSNSALGGFAGAISNGVLTLTDGAEEEAVSAYWDTPVSIQNFVASWTYVESDGNSRGYTFTLQNSGLTALGGTAVDLGYSGIQNSVSVEINTYSSDLGFALGIDGSIPPTPGGTGSVTLPTVDPLDFTVVYSGGVMSVTMVDTLTEDSFTTNYSVNIPATVLGNSAYVGFTGGDGYATSIQQVSNFSFFNFPTLTAQKSVGGGLVFTWPVGESIVLQENTNLAGGNWVTVTNIPSIVGGNDQVTLNPGATNLFFRLAIPVP